MGVYADFDAVAERFEGELPVEKQSWIEVRIDDIENELFGLIPGLADGLGDTPAEQARAGRVRRLICDKVLVLYRNPDATGGAVTVSKTMGPYADSRTVSGNRSGWVSFTDAELAQLGYVNPYGSAGSVKLRAYGT